jgi:hypothetical protein
MAVMAPDTNPRSDLGDDALLAQYGRDLARGVVSALPAWVERCVADRIHAYTGSPPAGDVVDASTAAGVQAAVEVGAELDVLLVADVDEQRANPLAVLRSAVRYPTEVLRDAGVPPVVRDVDAESMFPDDDYDLTPASFADISPELHDLGIAWGAAKAHVHLRRHRSS